LEQKMSDPTEHLMHGVIPYLTFDDATAAIAFYRRAFGALMYGDAALMPGTDRVANASLVINGGVMMLSDTFPNMGHPAAKGGRGFTMQLVVEDGDLWWSRAVEAGCEIVTPFAKQFWGDRYGQLRDPFGVDWAINEPSAENRAKAAHLKPT
jgi:PhnB protein